MFLHDPLPIFFDYPVFEEKTSLFILIPLFAPRYNLTDTSLRITSDNKKIKTPFIQQLSQNKHFNDKQRC